MLPLEGTHYIYEALLSEDEKQDIMTLIGRKGLMRWKQTNREKLYGDFGNSKKSSGFGRSRNAHVHC